MRSDVRKALDTELMVDLWPTGGAVTGKGRASTYRDAQRGNIPGARKIGGVWRVPTATLREMAGLPPISADRDQPPAAEAA